MAELHNLTFYVDPDELNTVRAFYETRLNLPVIFEEPNHIWCFRVTAQVAICVHEAEPPRHPAGTQELFFWDDDMDTGDEIHLVDPLGNHIRVHARE